MAALPLPKSSACGYPATQHETVLRRCDVEQADVAKAIGVLFARKLVRFRVRQNAIPAVERMFFVLPAFLFRDLGKRRAEKGFLALCRQVWPALLRVGGNHAIAGRAHIQREIPPGNAFQETGEIFFLLRCKTVRWLDRIRQR